MLCIKTIMNGWVTSFRVPAGVKHKCLFGCVSSDRTRHYLRCQPLWTIIASVMKLGTEFVDLPLRSRLGFSSPSELKCLSLALSFRIYHCVKNQHLADVVHARANDDFDSFLLRVFEIARVQLRELT